MVRRCRPRADRAGAPSSQDMALTTHQPRGGTAPAASLPAPQCELCAQPISMPSTGFQQLQALQSCDCSLEKFGHHSDPVLKQKKNPNIHGKRFFMNLFAGEMFTSESLKFSCVPRAWSALAQIPPNPAAVLARLGLISLAVKQQGRNRQAGSVLPCVLAP